MHLKIVLDESQLPNVEIMTFILSWAEGSEGESNSLQNMCRVTKIVPFPLQLFYFGYDIC